MPGVRHISRTLSSLKAVVEALDKLPDSRERATVLVGVRECRETVERWNQRPPTIKEKEYVMSRILNLHVAAIWLRRR